MKNLIISGIALALSYLPALPAAELKLSWKDNSDNETGFQIERRLQSEPVEAYQIIATTPANVAAYNDAAAHPGVTYAYRVGAYNASGKSGYTNEATGTAKPYAPVVTPPDPAPEPPAAPGGPLTIELIANALRAAADSLDR